MWFTPFSIQATPHKEIDEKIKEGVDKGIEDYKKKNAILNNINVEDDELKANIEELNKLAANFNHNDEVKALEDYLKCNERISVLFETLISRNE